MATNQIETEVLPEAQTFDKLATNHQEKTIHGSPHDDFLLKMSHPPRSQAFAGLPTEDTRSQVCTEYVNQFLQIQSKYVEGTTTFNRDNPTRVAFLQLTGLRILHIAFVTNLTDDRWYQDIANTAVNTLYNFKRNWTSDVQLYRPTFRSHTSTLNATAFNDTGMVAVNQFNPALLFQGVLSDFSTKETQLFIEHVKTNIKNGHYQVLKRDEESEWKVFPKFVRDEVKDKLNVENLKIDPNASIQILNLGSIGGVFDFVPDASQILTQSTRSYGSAAKEGTFTVTRLNTETPKFINAGNLKPSTDSFKGLYQCEIAWRAPDGGIILLGLTESDGISKLYDTAWSSDKTASWTLYEGLSYNAQALPKSNQQILIHKYYLGAELQPSLQSAFAGMCRLAPKPCFKNMQDLMLLFYDMKDSMPARYNFFGTLISAGANLLKKHAPSVIKAVMGEVGSMAGKDPTLAKDANKIKKMAALATQLEVDEIDSESVHKSKGKGKKQTKKIFAKNEKKVVKSMKKYEANVKHMDNKHAKSYSKKGKK